MIYRIVFAAATAIPLPDNFFWYFFGCLSFAALYKLALYWINSKFDKIDSKFDRIDAVFEKLTVAVQTLIKNDEVKEIRLNHIERDIGDIKKT